MICWTLGITEHHNAVDNVLALINLGAALRPRRPLRLGPEPAARPEQRPGRRRHGRDPEQAARASRTSSGTTRRARGSRRRGTRRSRRSYGWHLTQMFEAMERGELRTLYVIGENPAQSEADITHARAPALGARPPGRAGHRHDAHGRDGRRRAPRRPRRGARPRAPSRTASGACSGCARRSSRPALARDDTWILAELARRLGRDWGDPTAEEAWDELRSLSPIHRGMSYDRLEELGRNPVAVPRRGASRLAVPARAALGGARRRPARAVQRRRDAAAVRGARRRVPDPPDDRAAARVLQHGRAVGPLPLAAAPRRVARPLARGCGAAAARGRRGRARLVAPRVGGGAGADRPLAPRRGSRS